MLSALGWRTTKGGHALFHSIERVSATAVNFSVCNSGDGLSYHPVNLEKYPKVNDFECISLGWCVVVAAHPPSPSLQTLYRACFHLPSIPIDRVTNEAFLVMLLRLQGHITDENRLEVLYEVLLPYLISHDGMGPFTSPVCCGDQRV